MRRIVTTLMAACLLFFVACSDEGDELYIMVIHSRLITRRIKCILPFRYMKVLPVNRK